MQLPIVMDDAVCLEANGGLLIEPKAGPVRWLPFGLMAGLAVLTSLVWLLGVLALLGDFNMLRLVGNLVLVLVVTAVLAGLGFSLYGQWRALRMPVIYFNLENELIELMRAHSIRRIPFAVITNITVTAGSSINPVERLQSLVMERLQLERFSIGLVLKHGEVVLCGVTSGTDAAARAVAVGERVQRVLGVG